MRQFLLLGLLTFLLGACSQSTSAPPSSLDEITWTNDGPTPEVLTIRKDHTYKIVDPRQVRTSPGDSAQIGNYDVVSAQYGVILLDGRTPLRLSAMPTNARPFRFTPMTLTPASQVPAFERDQYIHLVDQYYASKSFLELKPNEKPIGAWLP